MFRVRVNSAYYLNMRRRFFLSQTILGISSLALPHPHTACSQNSASISNGDTRPRPVRVGIIGHTGRGNYGHGLDIVWKEFPEITIVGLADANPAGLMKAAHRLGLHESATFADYNKMLAEVRPDFISICPRHPDQRLAMCEAAIAHGVSGIYIEKPFCRTPAEGDEIIRLAHNGGVAVAVAHRNRYHPVVHYAKELMAGGALGKILEIRGRGKGDHRGGGEDLWVLGTHVLNLIHFLAGNPELCRASIYTNGRPAGKMDIHPGNEALGAIVGEEIHAEFRMQSGISAFFDSLKDDGTGGIGFGLDIIGSLASVRILCDRDPVAFIRYGNPFGTSDSQWRPLRDEMKSDISSLEKSIREVQNHVLPVRDLMQSAQYGRNPLCSAADALVSIEMVHAIFQSHFAGGGSFIQMPLLNRENCLAPFLSQP